MSGMDKKAVAAVEAGDQKYGRDSLLAIRTHVAHHDDVYLSLDQVAEILAADTPVAASRGARA